MVKQLNAYLSALFSGYDETERGPLNNENVIKFLREDSRVRCKDYVYEFDVENGAPVEINLTTTPEWFFILSNVGCWFEDLTGSNAPEIRVSFPDNVVNLPFVNSDINKMGVPSKLVFATEGGNHFEEYKNLLYLMDDRVNITVGVFPKAATYGHGAVILTGVELDLKGVE